MNEVQGAISCILGQVCVDGWKRGNLGRLVAVRLVKMLEKVREKWCWRSLRRLRASF